MLSNINTLEGWRDGCSTISCIAGGLSCQSFFTVDMSSNMQAEEREDMVTGQEKKGRRRRRL